MIEQKSQVAGAGAEPEVLPGKRRPGRPTLSNEELLETAFELFTKNGYERTSIEAIAGAAGMAKRTVYARYGDKTTLFKAALTRAIEEWIVPVEVLSSAESDDLEETLLRVGMILVANVLRPGGQRLLRLTNAVSGQMPEIAAFNVQKGTEPTLEYLADLFRRRLGMHGMTAPVAAEAAEAFIDLVVGGPANLASRGIVLDDAAVDRRTRYCVGLFLHGVLPRDRRSVAAEEENVRLRSSMTDVLAQLDRARDQLERARNSDDGDRLG
jgi:TetR/AcrR family transcriptional regulator, mexJK operon transcriptional repressor